MPEEQQTKEPIMVMERMSEYIEIGTAGKGGLIRVALDMTKVEESRARLIKAFEIREFANDLMSKQTPPQEVNVKVTK